MSIANIQVGDRVVVWRNGTYWDHPKTVSRLTKTQILVKCDNLPNSTETRWDRATGRQIGGTQFASLILADAAPYLAYKEGQKMRHLRGDVQNMLSKATDEQIKEIAKILSMPA